MSCTGVCVCVGVKETEGVHMLVYMLVLECFSVCVCDVKPACLCMSSYGCVSVCMHCAPGTKACVFVLYIFPVFSSHSVSL